MHPMMMALANEVEREREQERQNLQMRSLVLADPSRGSNSPRATSVLARRLIAGISLRLRVS